MAHPHSDPPRRRRFTEEQVLEALADDDTRRAWLYGHAKRPDWLGSVVYCEGGGFGFNPTGHFVRSSKIASVYRGHMTCDACVERYYPEPEIIRDALNRKHP